MLGGTAADITVTTRYNAQGQLVESRMPSDTTGANAGTTITTYYTAGSTSGCVNSALAGLACKSEPNAQPAGSPQPTITTSYDIWQQPLASTETYGTSGVTRRSSTIYDAGGRPLSSTVAVNPAASGGAPVPTVTTGYSASTGLPVTASSSAGTISTGYDLTWLTLGDVDVRQRCDLRVFWSSRLILHTNRVGRLLARGVRAHGEDRFGGDCGADRALDAAWFA